MATTGQSRHNQSSSFRWEAPPPRRIRGPRPPAWHAYLQHLRASFSETGISYPATMRVIVTGGAGFIGTLLARRLLARSACIGGGGPADVGELVIADLAAPAADVAADPRTRAVAGD